MAAVSNHTQRLNRSAAQPSPSIAPIMAFRSAWYFSWPLSCPMYGPENSETRTPSTRTTAERRRLIPSNFSATIPTVNGSAAPDASSRHAEMKGMQEASRMTRLTHRTGFALQGLRVFFNSDASRARWKSRPRR